VSVQLGCLVLTVDCRVLLSVVVVSSWLLGCVGFRMLVVGCAHFALKIFSLISEIKLNWIRFTCVSLFHYKISLLFFRLFLLQIFRFASLKGFLLRSETKRSKIHVYFFPFFPYFLLFFLFFTFFLLKFFDSIQFSNFCFKAKRGRKLFHKIQYFSHYRIPISFRVKKKNIFINFFA
jgi:hypothetical protein